MASGFSTSRMHMHTWWCTLVLQELEHIQISRTDLSMFEMELRHATIDGSDRQMTQFRGHQKDTGRATCGPWVGQACYRYIQIAKYLMISLVKEEFGQEGVIQRYVGYFGAWHCHSTK
ncbi:hypothetical protein NPIL_359291 [Nephila pilipes]|uniref:Uncharacterized protein n=1 Tax=Nephila pilipes TaxID=299642 RepID=A0A8X6U5V1_NEPPI|nr:hypothetical protein NPIL_359291 [Nephila pilipes]